MSRFRFRFRFNVIYACLALILVLPAILLAGCASTPRSVEALPQDNLAARYEQGQPVLQSNKINNVSVAVVEADDSAIVFAITVRNNTSDSFDLSIDNFQFIQKQSKTDAEQAGKVYTYAELAADGDSSLAWDSASIVTGAVVPSAIGGVAGIIANGFLNLGLRAARQSTADTDQNKPSAESYLRRHTLPPSSDYTGVFKVAIPSPPNQSDTLTLEFTTPADHHRFVYAIRT